MKTKVRRTKVHIYIYIYIHVYEGKALAYASKTHTHQLKRESYSCDSPSLSSGAICWTNLVSFFFFTGAANLNFSLSLVFFPIFILIVLRGVVAPLFLLMRQVREVFYFRLFSLGFHSKYGWLVLQSNNIRFRCAFMAFLWRIIPRYSLFNCKAQEKLKMQLQLSDEVSQQIGSRRENRVQTSWLTVLGQQIHSVAIRGSSGKNRWHTDWRGREIREPVSPREKTRRTHWVFVFLGREIENSAW